MPHWTHEILSHDILFGDNGDAVHVAFSFKVQPIHPGSQRAVVFLLQISFWFHSLVIAFGHIQNPFSRPKTYVLCVGFVASCCFEFTVLAVSITEPMAHIAIYALSLKCTVLQIFSFRHEWDGCPDLNNCSIAAAFVQWMDCYSFTFYIHVWRYIQAPQRWEWSLMFRDLVYFPYSCLGTCLDLLFSEVM